MARHLNKEMQTKTMDFLQSRKVKYFAVHFLFFSFFLFFGGEGYLYKYKYWLTVELEFENFNVELADEEKNFTGKLLNQIIVLNVFPSTLSTPVSR